MRLARNLIFWILDLFFYFKRIQNSISKKKIYSNIRVLIYHDFKSDYEIKQFKNQILSLKKEYEFISPDEFEEYLNKYGYEYTPLVDRNENTKLATPLQEGEETKT